MSLHRRVFVHGSLFNYLTFTVKDVYFFLVYHHQNILKTVNYIIYFLLFISFTSVIIRGSWNSRCERKRSHNRSHLARIVLKYQRDNLLQAIEGLNNSTDIKYRTQVCSFMDRRGQSHLDTVRRHALQAVCVAQVRWHGLAAYLLLWSKNNHINFKTI